MLNITCIATAPCSVDAQLPSEWAEGGMIAFLLERDRLRFEVRFDAAEHAGLKVSSRVLPLARNVHGKK
jgi:hypothetical protein